MRGRCYMKNTSLYNRSFPVRIYPRNLANHSPRKSLMDNELLQKLDKPRRTLVDRASSRGVTLADLSRVVGRNLSYIHQYVWKGAPRALPVAARAKIAEYLDIPEDLLRQPWEPSLASIVAGTDELRVAPRPIDSRDVPVFRDDEVIDPTRATNWEVGLDGKANGGRYVAIWATTNRGRLHPGDLVYVHMMQPPRVGDTVLALADQQVVALGELLALDGVIRIRDTEDTPREFSPKDVRLAKVVAVRFP